MNEVKSIYIHIPFCNNICTYCDFCKMYYNKSLVDKYLSSLEKEVDLLYKKDEIKTLYIGGGTPSCLSFSQLDRLFSIINKINLCNDYEFTFECNVEDISNKLLEKLKQNNVNRLSIGVQSFNNEILKKLGRSYNNRIIKNKIGLAKKYFDNINIDLIYGINGQSIEELNMDLEEFISLDINHISIYSLILENNTVLKINGYEELNEDLSRDMYDYICSFLKEHGFNHYEISNFEKNDTFSKHNLTYWNNDRYYGFGLGASGYIDNIRYSNTRSLSKYLKGNYRYIEEEINKKLDMENFMILGLRKANGISKNEFKKRYNEDISNVFNLSKLNYKNGYYFIEEDMLYISNQILKDFVNF